MNASITQAVRETVADVVDDGIAAITGDARDLAGVPLGALRFSTGLATVPSALPRRGLGLASHLVVPPGAWAVVHLPGGEQRVYTPGSYWLWGVQPGAILAQWVDARRQQVPVGPVEGWSADKWRVRLWLIVDVEVGDAAAVAAHREPLAALAAAARAGVLRYIEQHSHAELTGCVGETGGLDAPAQVILDRLRGDPALEGVRIVNLRLVERQGDERQIEAATAATVTAARIDEELRVADARNRARLHELEARAQIGEREHTLRMAAGAADARERLMIQQAEVQQAALAARLEIVMAQIRAQTSEIAHDEQVWQAEQARFQAEWDRAQRQQIETHQVDQQLRLIDTQGGLLRGEGELALVAEDRRRAHELALAGIQQQLAEQRTAQGQAIAERHAQHEQALLELHLRHEQLVAEQMHRLEDWRTQQVRIGDQQQRQHDRQMAVIAGTAQIAAAAAALPQHDLTSDRHEVADAGLQTLRALAE
jgi:hypothetical protein